MEQYERLFQLRKVNRAMEACILNPKHRLMLMEISQDIQNEIIANQEDDAA